MKDSSLQTAKLKVIPDTKTVGKETYKVALGIGFDVSKLGHIITNNHVISGCEKVKSNFKGISQEAIIVAVDRLNNLALLKVKTPPIYIFSISK